MKIFTKDIIMFNNSIPPEIQNLLNSREHMSRPREVYKEQKKERQNNSSRLDREDDNRGEVSARPAFGPEAVASQPTALDFVSSPQEVKGESGNVIAQPREHISRYSGVSVQHVRTTKGVKLAITLQKPDWADQGACQMVTAELKRANRLREVRAREEDSPVFAQFLSKTKQEIQESQNRSVCLGRLHQRGRRSQWLYDTLVVALFEGTAMNQVVLYVEGEEYVIDMNQELSENQQKYYHCQGRFGQIKSATKVPRIDDLPLVKFGE